jgi:starch phosphorylase
MLLYDTERLLRILTNPQRPVQLLISGKAHPADKPGQELIKKWIQLFFSSAEARTHIIFLSDYDMQVTENLARGVDLWINTPRRPWEACGTSGMKLLVNGGINLSELDGWWAEAYSPDVGWALGDFQEHGDDPAWDAVEANHLYDLLEKEVVPEFYIRDEKGIPKKWIARMRESMARLTPQYSADRCVRDYTEKHYLPRARSLQKRSNDKAAHAKKIVDWKHKIDANWPAIRFAEAKINSTKDANIFEIQVYLNDLNPDFIAVELYALGLEGGPSERIVMQQLRQLEGTPNTYIYRASVPTTRAANSYTARIIPKFEDVAAPLEIGEIIWQK